MSLQYYCDHLLRDTQVYLYNILFFTCFKSEVSYQQINTQNQNGVYETLIRTPNTALIRVSNK